MILFALVLLLLSFELQSSPVNCDPLDGAKLYSPHRFFEQKILLPALTLNPKFRGVNSSTWKISESCLKLHVLPCHMEDLYTSPDFFACPAPVRPFSKGKNALLL